MLGKNLIQAAAGNAASEANRWVAQVGETGNQFNLLERTDASLSLVATTTLSNAGYGVGFTPDGSYIVTSTLNSSNPEIRLFSHNEGSISLSSTYNTPYSCRGLAVHPSGNYVAICQDANPGLFLLNISSGALSLATTYAVSDQVRKAAWHPSGNYIAYTQGESIRVLSHSSGSFSSFSAYTNIVGNTYGVDWDPSGSYLAIGHQFSPFFTMLNAPSLSLRTTLSTGFRVWDTRFSKDGSYLALCGANNGVTILSHSSGSVSSITGYGVGAWSTGADFSDDNSYVVVGSEQSSNNTTLLSFNGSSLSFGSTLSVGGSKSNYVRFSPN